MIDFWTILLLAGAAGSAALLGGLIPRLIRPTTFFMSIAMGFAGGILIGSVAFEMIPEAQELSSLPVAAAGFAVGFIGIYAFDLFIHRGKLVGEQAAEAAGTNERAPLGDAVTVLGGGIAIEDVIQGLSIGIGAAIEPGMAIVVAVAVGFDAFTEGVSIGSLVLSDTESPEGSFSRVLKWCGVIGGAIFISTLFSWAVLQGMPTGVLAFLFATGGGAMLYLAITQLVPTAHKYHYQESSALTFAVGFLVILVLTNIM